MVMNTKYQHALDEIVRNSCPTKSSCNECNKWAICNCDMKIYVSRLQELIDLSTPKQAIKHNPSKIRYVQSYSCPNCELDFSGGISNYCYHCGQSLSYEE